MIVTNSIPQQIIMFLSQLAWPVFAIVMVIAAILFVQADRRHPAFCFLAGSILQFFIAFGALFLFGPFSDFMGVVDHSDHESFQKYFAIQNGASLVAQGLIVYGLLMIGLIQFRKSKMPKFEDDSNP